jgi:hypothetical protein
MKISAIVGAFILAVSAFVMTADGAFAAARCKSHSNTNNNREAGCPACPSNDTTGSSHQDSPRSKNMQSDSWRQSSAGNLCGTSGTGLPKCSQSDERSRDKANRAKCANNL